MWYYGTVTVTSIDPLPDGGNVTKPGIVADTVVVPAVSRSNATPPDVTLVGE